MSAANRILSLLLVLVCCGATAHAQSPKPRLLVLTDIGGDPDDQQSMVRLMLHANEFDIEGLIASASGTPGELKEQVTKPHLIREIVEAYGQVRPNLARHADGYPPAEELLKRIKSGNSQRGPKAIGEGCDTEGSRWIMSAAESPDRRPLNITIWGGQTDLAQSLWRVRKDRGADGLKQFMARLRVYDIGDQDKIQPWLFENFPDLFYVLAQAPAGEDKRTGAYRGMYLGGDESLTSRAWIDEHIRTGHGPLGALYPPKTWTAPNPHSALKEGDTPSWFFFLPVGLGDPGHPDWGSWGGRFTHDRAGLWRDAKDAAGTKADARTTVWRWRPAFQAEFQARMDWCIKPRNEANHPPVAVLNGDRTRDILELAGKPGDTVRLSAAGSSDPDGQTLTFRWFVYPEAGSYGRDLPIKGASQEAAFIEIPADAQGKTIHVILEVTDQGAPPLTRYRRAIIRCQ